MSLPTHSWFDQFEQVDKFILEAAEVPIINNTFKFSFGISDGISDILSFNIGHATKLLSLTIYINENNLGPAFVNAYAIVEDFVHFIVDGVIRDSEGFNALRLHAPREIHLSMNHNNTLVFEIANFSGTDILQIFAVGTLEKP